MNINELLATEYCKARAYIQPAPGWNVSGIVEFEETPEGVMINAKVLNLPEGKHGFHIHEGNECNGDFESAGGHYNPYNSMHGSPDDGIRDRHVGDLGNLVADEFEVAHYQRLDTIVALRGPRSIVGLAIVIHEHPDDFTTQPTGESGSRIGCGIIEKVK